MRTPVLAAMACLVLTALPAAGAPITFNAIGAFVDYIVPVTGQYAIIAVGAKGGDGVVTQAENSGAGTGGLGAEAGGTFSLTQGEMLEILVGVAGSVVAPKDYAGYAGGGGGGSFVVGFEQGYVPLVVAGGGGGGAFAQGFSPAAGYNGGDALTGPDGGNSMVGSGVQAGGLGGHGGSDGQGGIDAPVGARSSFNGGRGFDAYPSGLAPVAFGAPIFDGGAVGGGGLVDTIAYGTRTTFDLFGGAGGGGGYSGGGGGGVTFATGVTGFGGGGGGSYSGGADPILLARIGAGDGFVTITPAVMPEPDAMALFGLGLFGLFAVHQTRRR